MACPFPHNREPSKAAARRLLDQMATSFGLWSMARPCLLLLLTILATLSPSATAEICSFWDKGCVDPLAQTAIPFKFDPLFLETMNFFYAFDADSQGKGQAPMIKTGFWIGYQASTNNSVININRTSEIAVRVGNLTGTPSGGNNGCDGVWGSSCSNDLKTYLQETILEYVQNADTYSNPLSNVIHSFRSTPPILPNCSPTLFEVQNIPVICKFTNTRAAYPDVLTRFASICVGR